MKKAILVLVSLAVFTVVSCRDEKSKSETVIIEKQVETPKAKESNGTSLSIDDDGVEFSSKKGDKKTEINIKD